MPAVEFELAPGRLIGGDHPCFIIAEIGQNHQGDVNIAKKMIKLAKVRWHGRTQEYFCRGAQSAKRVQGPFEGPCMYGVARANPLKSVWFICLQKINLKQNTDINHLL